MKRVRRTRRRNYSRSRQQRSFSRRRASPPQPRITARPVGLYILHPNNVGRCGHIANASYAVRSDMRGKHVGRELVSDCLHRCKELGFRVLQFNAVVADNIPALALYKSLGFAQLGVIPGGFRKKDGTYADIIPHYFDVTKL